MKKIRMKFRILLWWFPKQTLRIMKLTSLFILMAFLQVSASVYSQNAKMKYIKASNQSIVDVLKTIEEETNFTFLYNRANVDVDQKVNLNLEFSDIEKALDRLLKGTNIKYRSFNNSYVLYSDDNDSSVSSVSQQSKTVKGQVFSGKGESLPGVTVIIKGTNEGTITDIDGKYTLGNVPAYGTLVFSFVGMVTKEVSVQNLSVIDVTFEEQTIGLEEVVAVGYGSVKKVNLTGSIDNVSGDVLVQRPVSNSANLIQGRLTGVDVVQPSGEPGMDSPTIRIRGVGSYGASNDPLILIDGVPGNVGSLSPSDIESVTVLKDAASAAIYGARAANGVILYTTKKGQKGEPVITYNANIGFETATRLPDFITNSAEYMEMLNTALTNDGKQTVYTSQQIENYRNPPAGMEKEYPNFDALDYWFQTSTLHNHNLSISGGEAKSLYNVSLSFLDKSSILPGYRQKRYNGLLNYSFDLRKWLKLGTSLNMSNTYTKQPAANSLFMPMYVYVSNPLNEPYLPDGSGRVVTKAYDSETFRGRPSPAEAMLMGRQFYKLNNFNPQIFVDIKPVKGLTWTTKYSVDYADQFYKMHQQNYTAYYLHEKDPETGDYQAITKNADVLGVTDDYSKNVSHTLYSILTYENKFREIHDISILAGYEQTDFRHRQLRLNRPNSVDPSLTELQGYSADNQTAFLQTVRLGGYSGPYEWALQSVFGRVTYSFKDKYLFEANMRYDGTSRVSADYRWGVFPSVSGSWVVSEENFIKDNLPWLNLFKLRASYGTLGNSEIGSYAYQENLTINNVLYPFDNSLSQGAVNTTFKDKSLKWETTRITDIGFDLNLKNGMLGATFDWFNKYTYNILAQQPIPASMGLADPTMNDGEMQNRGFEVELTHRHHIGKVNYDTYFRLSRYKNKVLFIRAESFGNTIKAEGYPYNEMNLYIWDGIFQESDIASGDYPTHQSNLNPKAGDLKMKDMDNDGDVDGDDRRPVTGKYPDFTYSFGFNLDYNRFGMSVYFQGSYGNKSVMSYWGPQPFAGGTPPTTKWRNAWTPENPTNELPALHTDGYGGVNAYSNSTYFLQNGSYLRLKNVMLYYSLPANFVNRIKCKDLKVYVSGDNLLTFTKFEGQDPERSLSSYTNVFLAFPQVRTINFGLNVKF